MSATSNPKLTVNVQLRHHRFSVGAYDEMVARGILTSGDRVELLAGAIVEMAPIGSRHAACVSRLTRFLTLALEDRAIVWVQNPVALPPDSQPEPDIAILRPRDDFYASGHPRACDVLLLIEVAESSLAVDRHLKLPLYARASVPEVWIVDLTAGAIEAYTRPGQGMYGEKRVAHGDATLTSTALLELHLRVRDILTLGGQGDGSPPRDYA
jgi:Uma2 family endonuclease